jgi:DNA-binding NarL/FixJ family response regulator
VDAVRDAVSRLSPDVVLLDVEFRRSDESLIPELSRKHPASRVIVLVDHGEDECALRSLLAASRGRLSQDAVALLDDCCLVSLRSSALGCLPKGSDPERVLAAVRTVVSGEIVAAPWLAVAVQADQRDKTVPVWSREQPITGRELEVIAAVAEGLSNKDVAERLGIKEQTVKNHLGRIMRKLGLNSRLEIGLFAARHRVAVRDRPRSAKRGAARNQGRQ